MQLFLEPIDVWLFRDGRPFDAGSDHRARSVFPPYPSVVQGAIRSHQLVVQRVDLRDKAAIAAAVGTADDVRDLRLRGPFLARRKGGPDRAVERLFPQPWDAVSTADGRIKQAAKPLPLAHGTISSAPTPYLLVQPDEPTKGEGNLWLYQNDLTAYLRGGTVTGVRAGELFQREDRLGIGIDSARRTTSEGALYEAEFVRPAPAVGLLIEVNGYDTWPARGSLRIGGEGRGAAFSLVAAPTWPAPRDPLPERFLVYFATPACFDGGWQPAGGDWSRFFSGDVQLLTAAVGRYESIGGFDLAAGQQKPARSYVPAGSVYYFAANGPARLRPELVQAAITDHGADIGYGQMLIEAWEEQ